MDREDRKQDFRGVLLPEAGPVRVRNRSRVDLEDDLLPELVGLDHLDVGDLRSGRLGAIRGLFDQEREGALHLASVSVINREVLRIVIEFKHSLLLFYER
ncbi:MAG: hypothetical protein CMQ40_10865 [Gammaproteobacteria bacterium]|nr:hypothetical protein [Gammaproteobacteria bacterium]